MRHLITIERSGQHERVLRVHVQMGYQQQMGHFRRHWRHAVALLIPAAHQLAMRTFVGVNAGAPENARAMSDVALMPSSETASDTRARMSPARGIAGAPDTSEPSPWKGATCRRTFHR
jgi:hypothetical protein